MFNRTGAIYRSILGGGNWKVPKIFKVLFATLEQIFFKQSYKIDFQSKMSTERFISF